MCYQLQLQTPTGIDTTGEPGGHRDEQREHGNQRAGERGLPVTLGTTLKVILQQHPGPRQPLNQFLDGNAPHPATVHSSVPDEDERRARSNCTAISQPTWANATLLGYAL